MRKIFKIIVPLTISACGLIKPDYIDYSSDVVTPPVADCATGLAAYQQYIASAVDNTCSGSSCHAQTLIRTGTLGKGNNAVNRAVLLSFPDTDGSSLFKKISSPSHGGNDQSKALPLEQIQAWRLAEKDCP